MHAWLKPVLDTAKCEIAYFCCMHILCPKILSRGVKYIQEILNRKFYTLQISDLSLNKHVNEGPSSCIICHFHFLLHCHCTMKQRQEEKCPKVLLWELLFFFEFLCKILVLTKQHMQDDLCLWVLPIDFNNTGHETPILLSGSMAFGKSQIQVSERSRVQFMLWAAWGLNAYFPRASPSSWNKKEFVGTAWPAKGKAYQSSDWEPSSFLKPPAASALLFWFSVP